MGKAKQFNPATGEAMPEVEVADTEVIFDAVKRARLAQESWAKLSYKERAVYIRKIKKYLADNVDECVKVISQSTGKTMQDALVTEALPGVCGCDWYAANTHKALRPQKLPTGSTIFANKSNVLVYEPVGVVGIITPWNYPFSLPFGEVLMGLMAGNAIVLKVASNVAHVGLFIERCVKASGLPEGVFQHLIVPGAQAGPAMLQAGVNKLFFTGSVSVGKELMKEAAKTLTPVCLELGGNDAMVVLEDASIERAVNCACWAGYQNAGQSCGGVERIYVHEKLYDTFVEQLSAKTRALRHGPDHGDFKVDIGSFTTKGQFDTVKTQVDEAVKLGAKIVAQSQPVGDVSKGLFFPATVITNVTKEMSLMKEETFGPILPVISFADEEEAIREANDAALALTSSVFSENGKHARAVAARLQSGVVTINDHLYTHGMTESPWGGWKESGIGRTHGYLGLREMSNVKCINSDMLPSWISPRAIYWYPFSKDSYETMMSVVRLVSPRSVSEVLKSLKTLVSNAAFMFTKWKVETKKEK